MNTATISSVALLACVAILAAITPVTSFVAGFGRGGFDSDDATQFDILDHFMDQFDDQFNQFMASLQKFFDYQDQLFNEQYDQYFYPAPRAESVRRTQPVVLLPTLRTPMYGQQPTRTPPIVPLGGDSNQARSGQQGHVTRGSQAPGGAKEVLRGSGQRVASSARHSGVDGNSRRPQAQGPMDGSVIPNNNARMPVIPKSKGRYGSHFGGSAPLDSFRDMWTDFDREIQQLKKSKRVKGRVNNSKSVSCSQNNCTICTDGRCIRGQYFQVIRELGLCKDAVCVSGCRGFVIDKDPSGHECPICKCSGFGLIEPCNRDRDCRGVKCDKTLNACKYKVPAGKRITYCTSSRQCARDEHCSFMHQYCAKRNR